jgi:proliferating cell nuclear antigen
MKLVLAEPRLLKESMNIISDLVNEVTLKIDQDKIELIAIDPANVAMIDFKLLSSAFVEYTVEKPEELAINLDHLKSVLKRAKPTDTVTMSMEEEKNRLNIALKGQSVRTFNIPLINIEESEQKLPNLSFTSKVVMSSSKFDDAVEDMSIVAESVALNTKSDTLIIKSESNMRDAEVEIGASEETTIIADEENSSKYSMEYLKKVSKASKLSDSVSLEFGNDYPLRAEYKLLDKLRLAFILAPRVAGD